MTNKAIRVGTTVIVIPIDAFSVSPRAEFCCNS